MRLLFECTYVFDHPTVHTGIQRVVRNIIGSLMRKPRKVECIPVTFKQGKLFTVTDLSASKHELKLGTLLARHDAARNRIWSSFEALDARHALRRWPLLRKILHTPFSLISLVYTLFFGMRMLVNFPREAQIVLVPVCDRAMYRIMKIYRVMRYMLRLNHWPKMLRQALQWPFRLACLPLEGFKHLLIRLGHKPLFDERISPFTFQSDDVLVLLDSSWHNIELLNLARRQHQAGMAVITVIYDLIPMTHPQFCDDHLVTVFKDWLRQTVTMTDGYMAISETISNQLKHFLGKHEEKRAAQHLWHGHFWLGNELDLKKNTDIPRAELLTAFDSAGTYLIVSTIEPRKNHAYALDAFETLWRNGIAAHLVILGRIGWKCGALIDRIRHHPEFGKRLFMCNDASDTELEYAYAHARTLVFPSFIEGFGLPLVEAMQHKLPVLCSDIPVFREIGGDYCAYFDPEQPATLAVQIAEIERIGHFPAKPLDDWSWITWDQSADQLIEGILKNVQERPAAIQRYA